MEKNKSLLYVVKKLHMFFFFPLEAAPHMIHYTKSHHHSFLMIQNKKNLRKINIGKEGALSLYHSVQ